MPLTRTWHGRKVVFSDSGDKTAPVKLTIDDVHIGTYVDFSEAEREAQRVIAHYPAKQES